MQIICNVCVKVGFNTNVDPCLGIKNCNGGGSTVISDDINDIRPRAQIYGYIFSILWVVRGGSYWLVTLHKPYRKGTWNPPKILDLKFVRSKIKILLLEGRFAFLNKD